MHTTERKSETDRERERETTETCTQFRALWVFADKAKYAHLQAESTDQCLLRNEMLLGSYKYLQDLTVGQRRDWTTASIEQEHFSDLTKTSESAADSFDLKKTKKKRSATNYSYLLLSTLFKCSRSKYSAKCKWLVSVQRVPAELPQDFCEIRQTFHCCGPPGVSSGEEQPVSVSQGRLWIIISATQYVVLTQPKSLFELKSLIACLYSLLLSLQQFWECPIQQQEAWSP